MSNQIRDPRREHHFYVSIAKFLFYHPQQGIVTVRNPMRLADAKRCGLVPIIIYGITVAGLPIRWLTFSTVDQRKSLREVLLTAWRNGEGLRGRPDILRVNRYVAQSDPGLAEDLSRMSVRLEIADSKDKKVPASLRSAHDASRRLWQRHNPVDFSLAACVEALCLDAQENHDLSARREARILSKINLEQSIDQWLELPMRQPSMISLEEAEWKTGPWMSSWETSLPPYQTRFLQNDDISGRLRLPMEQHTSLNDDDDEIPAYKEHDNTPEISKHLVACWPNPPKEIAAAVGITLRQLQWFTSERAYLEGPAQYNLLRLLGIEQDELTGRFTPTGPYVLIARKAQAIEAIYLEISGGGDACPCEIVPAHGQADPSWRFVLINAHSTPPTIVMAPRGEAVSEHLPGLMMNYEGVRPVSLTFYRDVVATCARACLTPQANIREMKEFARRYEQHWNGCAWLPD